MGQRETGREKRENPAGRPQRRNPALDKQEAGGRGRGGMVGGSFAQPGRMMVCS